MKKKITLYDKWHKALVSIIRGLPRGTQGNIARKTSITKQYMSDIVKRRKGQKEITASQKLQIAISECLGYTYEKMLEKGEKLLSDGTEQEKYDPSKPSVLIVDDRVENIKVMKAILENDTVNILSATNGSDALSTLLSQDFSLVLLDVMMPDMDGFEVAKLMRTVEETKHVPIIFVTAISKEPQHIFKGYELGAIDYILKPFDANILRAKVKVLLDLYQKTKDLNNYKLLLEQKSKVNIANLLEIHNDLKLTQQQNEQRIIQMNGLLAQLEARIIDNKYTKNNTELISLISSLNELIQECQTDNK